MSTRLLGLLLVSACGAPAGNTGFSASSQVVLTSSSGSEGSTGTSGGASGMGGTSSTGGEDSVGSSQGDASGMGVLDVGSMADLGDGKPAGCKGKIDFLFVVSRAWLMEQVQTQLIKAFPDFLATIQAKFVDFDYHIMVVDGGGGWGSDWCNEKCTPQGCPGADYFPCDLVDTVTECDQTLGAGTIFPAGGNAANKPCGVADGRRFLTKEQPQLAETFACIAQVGTSGVGWVGEALTEAMSPQLNWKDSCNEGFLRNDALLMVTLVADWDREGKPLGSAGSPEEWGQAILDAKKGDSKAVVMLNICDPECQQPYDRACVLAKSFPFHHIGSLLAEDYSDAFEVASDLVGDACEGFVAPG